MRNSKINLRYIIIFLMLFVSSSIFAKDSDESRQRLLMDFNWKFKLGDQQGAEKTSFNDSGWRKLNLPHDWSIEGEYNKDEPTCGSGVIQGAYAILSHLCKN
jgi:beta-galactosidase